MLQKLLRGLRVTTLVLLAGAFNGVSREARAQQPADAAQLQQQATQLGLAGRHAEALELALKALEQANRQWGKGHPQTAPMLMVVAMQYQSLGRLADAEPYYREAVLIKITERPADLSGLGTISSGLGAFLYGQGRAGEAEPFFRAALENFEKVFPPDHPMVGGGLYLLGTTYNALNRLDEAEKLLLRSAAIFEKVPNSGFSLGFVYNNLALALQLRGDLANALTYQMKALQVHEKVLPPGHPSLGSSLSNIAYSHFLERRLDAAEENYKRAIAILDKAFPNGSPVLAVALVNYADLKSLQGRTSEATPLYQRALVMRQRSLPEDHRDIAYSHNALASDALAANRFTDALGHARKAAAIFVARSDRDRAGPELANRAQGKSEIDQFRTPFQLVVKSAFRVDPANATLRDESFIAAQHAQQTTAGQALAQMAARQASASGALAAFVREHQDTRERLRQADRQLVAALSEPPDQRKPAAEADIRQRIAAAGTRLQEIDGRLLREFPAFADLTNPKPLSLVEVQRRLSANDALLLYLDTPRWYAHPAETFAWLVTRDRIRWQRLGEPTENLYARIRTLRCGLDRDGDWQWSEAKERWVARTEYCAPLAPEGFASSSRPPFNLEIAHGLYKSLLGPFAADIAGKHLMIVPSWSQTSLPFHVLVSAKPEAAVAATPEKLRAVRWLARSHAITMLPSVASLASLSASAGRSVGGEPYVAFGNPLLLGAAGNNRSAWAKQSCQNAPVQRLAARMGQPLRFASFFRDGRGSVDDLRRQQPLPESADELCAVARDLRAPDSDVHLGARATEYAIKTLSASGTLKSKRIVHFATHGLLAGETQSIASTLAEPSLLLTPPDIATELDDGLLTASEVAGLDLNADWVILSACNTAGPDGTAGSEPLSGLARAFFYAGARALLVSHWYVESDGAVKLTTRAIAELQKSRGIGRAEALRRSVVALIDDKSRPASWPTAAHPAVWAPFVVVGDGAPGR